MGTVAYSQCLCNFSDKVVVLLEGEDVFWSVGAALQVTADFLPDEAFLSGAGSGLRYPEPLGTGCTLSEA